MNNANNKLAEFIVSELPSGTQKEGEDLVDCAIRVIREQQSIINGLFEWTGTYDTDLCPRSGYADTFGEGMRFAKKVIRNRIVNEINGELLTSTKRYLGWNWLHSSCCLPYGDDRRPIKQGSVRHYDGRMVLGPAGLRWSPYCLDALVKGHGSVVCRIEAWGETVWSPEGDERYFKGYMAASRYRKVLWMFDASDLLWRLSCDIAKEALREAGITDSRAYMPIKVRREKLDGKRVSGRRVERAYYAAKSAAGAIPAFANLSRNGSDPVSVFAEIFCDEVEERFTTVLGYQEDLQKLVGNGGKDTRESFWVAANERLEEAIFAEASQRGYMTEGICQ